MARTHEQLAPGDWAVLSLVAEGPTHGFAIARLMEPGGEVGRVWALRRPLVYRSLETLTAAGLIRARGTEPSTAGPPRTIFAITAQGRRALEAWREVPIARVRDARSFLLLKLLFLDRAGLSPATLLAAQRDVLAARRDALAREAESTQGFDRTLALWRLETTAATVRFTEALLSSPQTLG